MGYSPKEIEDARAAVPEQYRPTAQTPLPFPKISEVAASEPSPANEAQLALNEAGVDGTKADDPLFEDENDEKILTAVEARNLAERLAKADRDEEFQAALSGTLAGRIFENYFDKNQFNQKTTREKDQKARAEMYYIAILQAQIEALDAQIADLTNKIDNFRGQTFYGG